MNAAASFYCLELVGSSFSWWTPSPPSILLQFVAQLAPYVRLIATSQAEKVEL